MKKIWVAAVCVLALCLITGAALADTDSTGNWDCSDYNYNGEAAYALIGYLGTATEVTVPASVEVSGITRPVRCLQGTFNNDPSVVSVNTSDSLRVVGYQAFRNCPKLTLVKIRSGVTEINAHAFDGTDLTKMAIQYGGTLAQWQALAGLQPPALKALTTREGSTSTTWYSLTVRYVYEDGSQAAPTYSALHSSTEPFSVASPVITGYTPSDASIGYSSGLTKNTDVTVTYTPIRYSVSFMNFNQTETLQRIEVPYGETPVYTGATPVKPDSHMYTYTFTGWSPEIVPATQNATYTAQFSQTLRNYTLVLSADPAAGGTVTGGGTYAYGTSVTATATPNPGWRFVEWTYNDWHSTNTSESFSLNENWTLVAHFELITYSVTVTAEGQGTASASPVSGTMGTEVTLTATPADGWAFKEWQVVSGGVTVENDKFTIGTANVEINAVFEETAGPGPEPLPDTYSDDTGSYAIDQNGEAEFQKPAKAGTSAKIPDAITVNGQAVPVTKIADNAFKNQKKLTKVTIGANIKEIGKNAFMNCVKLKTVSGGANLEIIGDSAFSGCKALKSFTIGAKVTKIGKKAFYKCAALKKITIKSKLLTKVTVGGSAFKGIYKTATIKVPKAVKKEYTKWLLKKGVKKTMKIK